MDLRKRTWIYQGIGMPTRAGVVVATGAGRRPRATPGARLLVIGDAHAKGLSVPLARLSEAADVAFRVEAHPGATVWDLAHEPWLARQLESFGPTVVLISLGTNDLRLAERPDLAKRTAEGLRRLGPLLRGLTATVGWLEPPALPLSDRGLRAAIRRTRLPSFPSAALALPRGPDGVTPTAMGYAGWAGAVWRWLA